MGETRQTDAIFARHGAAMERITVLERALEKIGVIASGRMAQERPRIAVEDIKDLADKALGS